MIKNERGAGRRQAKIALAALFALAGCGDDEGSSTAADGGSKDADAAAPDAAQAPEGVVTGSVYDVVTKMPVAGSEVCVYQHPEEECATTATDGSFQLITEERGRVALTVTTADYANMLLHLEVSDEGGSFIGAPTIQLIHAGGLRGAATGNATADPTKGDIASGMLQFDPIADEITGPATGATATATPDSGVGPVYLVGGAPDAEAAGIGDGGYYWFGMDPGEVTLTLAQVDGSCERRAGVSWPAADASRKDQSTVLIVAGYISVLGSNLCMQSE